MRIFQAVAIGRPLRGGRQSGAGFGCADRSRRTDAASAALSTTATRNRRQESFSGKQYQLAEQVGFGATVHRGLQLFINGSDSRLEEADSIIPALVRQPGPARLVPLQSLAGPAISYPALRQAATRGRLEAEIGSDGLWGSNQHAVDAYLANRHQRRTRTEPTTDR